MLDKKTWVVAVSGGVDSIVLLHMLLTKKPDNITYIIAHFDHGIRKDSEEDAKFVAEIAKNSQTQFELGKGNLGAHASEATARAARYSFLRDVAKKYDAEHIITAHHEDDVIESIVINLLRGTGPRGLNPMSETDILRPLIHRRKADLLAYAHEHQLQWREDITNQDESYLRNYVRKNLLDKLEPARAELLTSKARIAELYHDIDMRMQHLLPKTNVVSRTFFVGLNWSVQREFIRHWLLKNGLTNIAKADIERLAIAAKTLPAGKRTDVDGKLWLVSEPLNVLITSK